MTKKRSPATMKAAPPRHTANRLIGAESATARPGKDGDLAKLAPSAYNKAKPAKQPMPTGVKAGKKK